MDFTNLELKKTITEKMIVEVIFVVMLILIESVKTIKMDVIACNYESRTWWVHSMTADWAVQETKWASVEGCFGCIRENERVKVTTCFRKATVCINPPIGNKYEGNPKQEIINCGGPTHEIMDLSYRPPLVCRWSAWETLTTDNWQDIYVQENTAAKCDELGCSIDGKTCVHNSLCGNKWVLRPFKGEMLPTSIICEVTGFGVYCPELGRGLNSGDKIIKSNVSLGIQEGSAGGDIDNWVKTLQNRTDNFLRELKLTSMSIMEKLNSVVSITDNFPGLTFGGSKLYISPCTSSEQEILVSSDGFWMLNSYYVNPFSRELFTERRSEWHLQPIMWNDMKIGIDGSFISLNASVLEVSILKGNPGFKTVFSDINGLAQWLSQSNLDNKTWTSENRATSVQTQITNQLVTYNWLHWVWGVSIMALLMINMLGCFWSISQKIMFRSG